ncbi:MAG TPA: hypothetical protein PLI43_19750 [Albidovulum sp.]|uniref:hypothetical protein n=1 Tax=Albidovulum sp. TaxID=1872424 RepID=UPI002B731465|nr:hypothetical protein [Albidovulum sp.]
MAEYDVRIGFWLRAYDGFTVEAATDEEAIGKARAAALAAMELTSHPGHIDFDARREGIIAFIDQVTADQRRAVAEDVEFDTDRFHGAPSA